VWNLACGEWEKFSTGYLIKYEITCSKCQQSIHYTAMTSHITIECPCYCQYCDTTADEEVISGQHKEKYHNSYHQQLIRPLTSCNYYQKGFFPLTITDWNKLPNEIIECSTLDEFLYHLNFCDYV